jgi:DNA-binding MarR family transcriptional regulator
MTQPDGDFEALLAVRIRVLADRMELFAQRLFGAAYGVRFADVRILAYLAKTNRASVAEISRDLNIDKAWISRLVRELEEKGLATKTADPEDSRAVLVSATAKGRHVHEQVLHTALGHEAEITGALDLARLSTDLTKLEAGVAQMMADQG